MTTEAIMGREEVLRLAHDSDVKFIRLWFADILGHLKGFAITINDLEEARDQGVGFDGSAIDGFARHHESDMRAYPDSATFTLCPGVPVRMPWPGCSATYATSGARLSPAIHATS